MRDSSKTAQKRLSVLMPQGELAARDLDVADLFSDRRMLNGGRLTPSVPTSALSTIAVVP